MLKNLPIIPSRTSQNFYLLFFFIPIAPPFYSIVSVIILQCSSDYIYYLHSRLCLLTALIEYLTVLLEYLNLLQTNWQAQQTFGRGWALQGMLFGYATV